MKVLHTSDWHVGRTIRGESRAAEHRAVLDEMVTIAERESVDLVIVAGDLFDTTTPSPESDEIVYRALLGLARTGAHVAVIAGNHDNPRRLRAVAPLLELGDVHLLAEATRPTDGGVLDLQMKDGTPVRIALLPFVSKRGIVRAADLMSGEAFEHAQEYAERLRLLIDHMCSSFEGDRANILATHLFVLGGQSGGGERAAHLIDEYAVTAQSFPASIGYGALGHLHRAQRVASGAPLHYCGSPMQLDFGETNDVKQVNLVTMEPGVPADVVGVPLQSGRNLVTIRGTLDELLAHDPDEFADAWLRVIVESPRRAGLAEQVREVLGSGVVDVRIESPDEVARAQRADHTGKSPIELFAEYLGSVGVDDDRVTALFAELLDAEISGADS